MLRKRMLQKPSSISWWGGGGGYKTVSQTHQVSIQLQQHLGNSCHGFSSARLSLRHNLPKGHSHQNHKVLQEVKTF